jgi:hypothetical protein
MRPVARLVSVLFAFAIPACAGLAQEQEPAQQLLSRRTADLNLVYYDKAHEYLSYHAVRTFENSMAFHKKLFGYEPSEPVLVLMQDFGDYGHGGTSTVPWNYISIGIEPFDYVYDVMPANERMNWLMHHELVHVVATDKGAGSDLRYRKFFGGKVEPIAEQPMSMAYSFLTSPRWYSPRWYHEGIAVFLETWMAGGLGRVLGGYDEMAFRTMVLEDAYFYDVVGLESEGTTIDFQVGQNSYLYGTRFVTWLAMEHGPEKLIQWFNRTPGSKRYFSAQFQQVYGSSLENEWARWIAWEHEWQEKNLARIRQYAVTKETAFSDEALGSVSRTFYDANRGLMYAAINRPAKPAQIVAVDAKSRKVTPLATVTAPALYFVTSLAYDAEGRKLFFTTDNTRGWRDIHELDLQNGKRRLLLKDVRTGDLVVNPTDQSIWGKQVHNGLSAIVRIPKPYTKWEPVMQLEYGRDVFDLDISPDGKTLTASLIEVSGEQKLIALDTRKLIDGQGTFDVLHKFENNNPLNFVFSRDGRYLYGTSYLTGVSNVFRFDFETRKMEAITNAETGLFRPVPIAADTLLAYRYTSKGFLPVTIPIEVREDLNAIDYLGQQIVEKHPIVKEWNAGSPARVNLDTVTTYAGPYKAVAQLGLASFYPVLEGYKDSTAAGFRFNLGDPLGLNSMDFTAAYSPDEDLESDERLHLKLAYRRAPWELRLKYNATDFYDLFGPTKTGRKGYSAALDYSEYLVFERPKTFEYTLSGAYYGGLDTLPDFQNVPAPYDAYSTVGGNLHYSNLRRTLGAVDSEYGTGWSLDASGSYVNSEFFSQYYGTLDKGFILPIEHSSLWLRGAAGKSFGAEDNAFANFYFGGFGNNWVDHREIHRYREFYAFPGLELNEASGTDFGKLTVEWQLPAWKFRKVGVPGFYTNWSRLSLFTSGLVTNMTDDVARQEIGNVGAQLDFSTVLFSNLDSMISFGYAAAFPEKGDRSDEVMISLRLLR